MDAKTAISVLIIVFLGLAIPDQAQQGGRTTDRRRSPVFVNGQRQDSVSTVDTALLVPKNTRRKRMRVTVVPAPPPGRSRQEILYSDSLGRGR